MLDLRFNPETGRPFFPFSTSLVASVALRPLGGLIRSDVRENEKHGKMKNILIYNNWDDL